MDGKRRDKPDYRLKSSIYAGLVDGVRRDKAAIWCPRQESNL